jgi:hypothetical protein
VLIVPGAFGAVSPSSILTYAGERPHDTGPDSASLCDRTCATTHTFTFNLRPRCPAPRRA